MTPRLVRRRTPFLLLAAVLAACPPLPMVGWASHSCALLGDGSVWCWGYNSRGELGDGTTWDRRSPVQVVGLPPASSVAAGRGFTCASARDGRVFCWGRNDAGQLGVAGAQDSRSPAAVPGISGAAKVVAGGFGACALEGGGGLTCWGSAVAGSGVGPSTVAGLPDAAVDVAAGPFLTCAALASGAVWCWGGAPADSGLTGAVGVAIYRYDPCALRGDGSVSCASALALPATAVAAGSGQGCAVLSDATVWCWGEWPFGDASRDGGAFEPIPYLDGASAVSVGSDYACAVAGGAVACWGDNWAGQLGDGSDRARAMPATVAGLPGPAVAVSAGTGYEVSLEGCGGLAVPHE